MDYLSRGGHAGAHCPRRDGDSMLMAATVGASTHIVRKLIKIGCVRRRRRALRRVPPLLSPIIPCPCVFVSYEGCVSHAAIAAPISTWQMNKASPR